MGLHPFKSHPCNPLKDWSEIKPYRILLNIIREQLFASKYLPKFTLILLSKVSATFIIFESDNLLVFFILVIAFGYAVSLFSRLNQKKGTQFLHLKTVNSSFCLCPLAQCCSLRITTGDFLRRWYLYWAKHCHNIPYHVCLGMGVWCLPESFRTSSWQKLHLKNKKSWDVKASVGCLPRTFLWHLRYWIHRYFLKIRFNYI